MKELVGKRVAIRWRPAAHFGGPVVPEVSINTVLEVDMPMISLQRGAGGHVEWHNVSEILSIVVVQASYGVGA